MLISLLNIDIDKNISFYFNLMNLVKLRNDGIGKYMQQAARPSGGMDSSNLRRRRGEQLH